MYSSIIPFEDVVSAVKDLTGINNITNLYPQIRRYINRIEKEIGRGPTMILKRKTYSVSNSLIQNNKIKLPDDMVSLESFGMCHEGMCPSDYIIQGNYAFLCRPIDSFSLIYYALLCDGTGNPVIVENHFEAVVHGIAYFMYKNKMFNNEGNFNFYKDLEKYYEDRIGEARGNDLMPDTEEEWRSISSKWNMSLKDYMIYDQKKKCYCCVEDDSEDNNENNLNTNFLVYYFQFDDVTTDISFAMNIDEEFLALQQSELISVFLNGFLISFNKIGRTGFAFYANEPDLYRIYDVFNTDITDIVFNKYYNTTTNLQVYISKEISTFANIYYKFIKL